MKLVELQKGVWEELGVTTEAGRAAVGAIESTYEDSQELLKLREDFARATDAAYLQCLRDRRPKTLEKKAKLPRASVLDFLDACCVRLEDPAVKERLRKHIEETGAMPDAAVNGLHDEVMEEFVGFEREHGRRCFEKLGSANEFGSDREVAMSYA